VNLVDEHDAARIPDVIGVGNESDLPFVPATCRDIPAETRVEIVGGRSATDSTPRRKEDEVWIAVRRGAQLVTRRAGRPTKGGAELKPRGRPCEANSLKTCG
jgi:hypothetical protein